MASFDELIAAQLAGATVRSASLIYFDFKSGPVWLWSGFGDLTIDGETYQGIGRMGTLSPIIAGPGGAVQEVTATLFGDAAILANIEADAEESAGRQMEIRRVYFDVRRVDEAGTWVDWQVLGSPLVEFVGTMGPLTVKRQAPDPARGGATRTVSMPCQNVMINRGRPALQFFTDRDQKARSPDDNLLLRVAQYSEGSVRWPIF